MQRDLEFILPQLPHVRDLGVIRLAQEPGEAVGAEHLVILAMERRHPEPERLVRRR